MADGNKEVLKILELIEKGVINVDEAKELINSVNNSCVDFTEEKEKVKDNIKENISKMTDSYNETVDSIKMKVDPKIKKVLTSFSEKLDEIAENLYDEHETEEELDEHIKEFEEDLEETLKEFEEELEESVKELNSLDGNEEEVKNLEK